MHGAAGVFLQMDAPDAHALGCAIFQVDFQLAIFTKGQLVLADLVSFGQIWISVIFARKDRTFIDAAIERKARHDDVFNGLLVDHRKHAGHAEADRAHMRVGVGTGVIGTAAAEHLALGNELAMNLEADDGLVPGSNGGQTASSTGSQDQYRAERLKTKGRAGVRAGALDRAGTERGKGSWSAIGAARHNPNRPDRTALSAWTSRRTSS